MTRTEDSTRERELERYLLGILSDDEKDRLESALLADHDLFSELDAAEGMLIDRYLDADLSPDDRRLFEERLLPSERVRERIAMAGSLQRLADQRARRVDDQDGGEVVPISPFHDQKPVPGRSATSWLAWAACLVLMLATGYLTILNVRLQNRFDNAQSEHQAAVERASVAEKKVSANSEALDKATLQALDQGAEASRLRELLAESQERVATLESTLTSSPPSRATEKEGHRAETTVLFLALATRAEGQYPVLELPIEGPVRLQLDLDRLHPTQRLMVTVKRSGVPVWRQDDIAPVFLGSDSMLPLDLPAELFFEGTYTIEVSEVDPEQAVIIGAYTLTVRHK